MRGLYHALPFSPTRRQASLGWWVQRKFWLGIGCSAFFLFLAFRHVHWGELRTALQAMDRRFLLLAAVVYILRLMVGGLRWRALLAPVVILKVREAFAYLNIGHMANNLLPLRAGELIRCVLLGEKKGVRKSAVLATIVVDRLLDAMVLVACTFILMLAMPIPPLIQKSALALGGVSCLVIAGLWWVAGHIRPPGALGTQGMVPSVGPLGLRRAKWASLVQKALRFGRSFASGLEAIRSLMQAGAALGYSVLGWGVSIGFTWLVLQACHLDLPWTAALMVIVLLNFGTAIPSAPGFIGVAHFLVMTALKPWAVEHSAALGFAIVYHALGFLITVGIGVACLGLERPASIGLSGQPLGAEALQDQSLRP